MKKEFNKEEMIREIIRRCQKAHHVQQVVFSTYRDCLTQICFGCDKYLGFRGFCSKECHDKYYDEHYGTSSESQDSAEKPILKICPIPSCGKDYTSVRDHLLEHGDFIESDLRRTDDIEYIGRVTCRQDTCFQFVSESLMDDFKKITYYKIKILEVIEPEIATIKVTQDIVKETA